MENPFAPRPRRSQEPTTPKNTFQRELEAKMRDRRSRGLTSGITPDPSEHDSGDELDSDNELMSNFNTTSKRANRSTPMSDLSAHGDGRKSPWNRSSPLDSDLRKSPYAERRKSPLDTIFGNKDSMVADDSDEDEGLGGNLMMTMKKPMTNTWQPPGAKQRNTTPSPKFRKSKGMGLLNEDEEDNFHKPWQPPVKKRFGATDKENEKPGSRSPGISGRKTPSMLDSLDEDDYPYPTPRSRSKGRSIDEEESPRPVPRTRHKVEERERPKSRGTPTKELKQRFGSRKNEDTVDGKSPQPRKSVLDMMDDGPKPKGKPRKKSLLADSDDSLDEEVQKTSGRKSPFQRSDSGRKSPFNKHRKSPLDTDNFRNQRKSPFDSMYNQRKSPFQEGRRSITFEDEDKSRGSPWDSGKPSLKSRSTFDGDEDDEHYRRRSPSTGHKSPFVERKPSLRRRQDAVDEDDDDQRAFKPILRKGRSKSRDDVDSEEDERQSRSRNRPTPKQRMRPGSHGAERESSLCRDVEHDPTLKIGPSQESKELRKAAPRVQRKDKQLLDSAIDRVQGAQDSGMKYIDPDKTRETNEAEEQRARTPKFRPKPRYAKPQARPLSATSAPPDFNSTSSIRDAVFQEWQTARLEQKKQELREKKRGEKEKEEKEKKLKEIRQQAVETAFMQWLTKEKEEKLLEAKASYNAWLESKKSTDGDKIKAKRREEEKKKKKLEEEEEKKREAASLFKSWKENKDVLIKEREQAKKRKEEKERRKKQEEEAFKRKDAKNAFRGWEKTKGEKIEEQKRQELRAQKAKERAEREAKEDRENEALDSYKDWLHNKEKEQRRKSKMERLRTYHMEDEYEDEEEGRPAWSPAGRTIPFGR